MDIREAVEAELEHQAHPISRRVRLTPGPCHRRLRELERGGGITRLDSCATLRDQRLATLAGVRRLTSTIVMKRVAENRSLPIAT